MATNLSRRDLLKTAPPAGFGMVLGSGLPGGKSSAATKDAFAGAYDGGTYRLPPLPYDYNALEPLYSEQTLRIHHGKHHAAYVNGLNTAMEKLQAAREKNYYAAIRALRSDLAFNGSGHVLHMLFWHSMSPNREQIPDSLAEALTGSFGSVQNAQDQFAAATKAVMSNGWGALVYEPIADKLSILQVEKHLDLVVWGATPLLVAMSGNMPTTCSTRTTGGPGSTVS